MNDTATSHRSADRNEDAGRRTVPPGFVRAMLDDARYTDSFIDALEERLVALEEVAAARGIRHITAALRLRRSLRASVQPFAGRSFAERRYEAASAEWEPRTHVIS